MSEQTKWTPGPWSAEIDRDEVPVVKSQEGGIADIWTAPLPRREYTADSRWAEAAANAHLIAAAPELYEALVLAADTLKGFDGGNPEDETGWAHDELREAWVTACAALSKARAAS